MVQEEVCIFKRQIQALPVIWIPWCLHKISVLSNVLEGALTDLIPNSNHDPILVAGVWHACMPSPEIADEDVTFLASRLNRRSYLTTCLDYLGPNVAGRVADFLLGEFVLGCAGNLVGTGGLAVGP